MISKRRAPCFWNTAVLARLTWLLLAVVFAVFANRAQGSGSGNSKTQKSHAPRRYSGKWLTSQSLIRIRSKTANP
jgi:hypothetical protein